jgi:hypothetical protein
MNAGERLHEEGRHDDGLPECSMEGQRLHGM